MQPEELLETLKITTILKTTTRHNYTMNNRKESVADHTYQMAIMAFLLKDQLIDTDMSELPRLNKSI